ncbi:MAG TPA: glycosyltransferase, partial [Flavitalea sp.]|nr:glycosyltransferase [Flavitalea sp.]
MKSVAIQSQVKLLDSMGFEPWLLTWAPEGELHEKCREAGAKTFSAFPGKNYRGIGFFVYHIFKLKRFCRENKISTVFSHLQSVGMTAGLAGIFSKVRSFYFRHNSDYFQIRNSRKELFINKMANRFCEKVIAISDKVKDQLLKEGVKEEKIVRINLCYDFDDYGKASEEAVTQIRDSYKPGFLLLAAARLDPLKRHTLCFDVVKRLAEQGVDVKLLCIGDGPEKENLLQYITANGLEERVKILGFVENIMDYFTACDMLIHLSYSEASSHVAKEAGICRKPIVVCRDVGDFEEYLADRKNAFLVDKEAPVEATVRLIRDFHNDKKMLGHLGDDLHGTVLDKFSIESAKPAYKGIL